MRAAYFNLFSGFSLKEITFGHGQEKFFFAREVNFGFDVLSLLSKSVRIKSIDIQGPELDFKNVSDIIILGKKSFDNKETRAVDQAVHFFETVYFNVRKAKINGVVALDIKGYLSFIKGNLFISRGEILLKKIQISTVPDIDFFRNSSFYKPFDYIFEAENQGANFVVSRLEVSNPALKFTGSGSISDIQSKPSAAFEINFFNILLDDFPSINSKVVQSRGVVDSTLQIKGALDNLSILCNSKITNAHLVFFNSIIFSEINGSAVVAIDHIVGQNFSLFCNGIPFSADFVFLNQIAPQLLLQLSSHNAKGAETKDFILRFSADWLNDEFLGNLKTSFRYMTSETSTSIDCNLKDFRLKYEDDLFVTAEGLTSNFSIKPAAVSEKAYFNSNLNLEHFFAILRRQEDGFTLDNLKGNCYDGILEGSIEFVPKGSLMSAKGEAHVRGVDVNEFIKDVIPGQYVLSGLLDGDLRFDTQSEDILKGQFFVTKGTVENNPILDSVGNFLGVSALKKVSFDELSMFFSGGRGEYSSQVKLKSSQVNGILDGKISSYDKLDGYLTVRLGTELLNESKTFKKILTYIRHEEPSVAFPFKISSYINSPRILWLKNEFKEKLQNMLPERNKRYLQGQVNNMVSKIEEE